MKSRLLSSDRRYSNRRLISITMAILLATSIGTAHANGGAPTQGPFNALAGTSGAGVNNSSFLALSTGTPPAGTAVTASVNGASLGTVYAMPKLDAAGCPASPITCANNATFWVDTPAGAGPMFDVVIAWAGGTKTIPVVETPQAGAEVSVVQDAPGSTSITVTAYTPKFTGLVEPISQDSYITIVHVFDAATGEYIATADRPGVVKSVEGDRLKMVDPLVLPDSALGRTIRIGFLSYYYTANYQELASPLRYAGLSAAITLNGSGGASAPATRVSMDLELSATSTTCTGGSPSGFVGAWLALPAADACTSSDPKVSAGARLLGWSPSANFPVAIAQAQIDRGWGVYDGPIDGVRIIFIPAGMSTFVSGPNSLHPVWSTA